MDLILRNETSIAELFENHLNAPDFSFLETWDSRDSFFPKLNGAAISNELSEHDARQIQRAIDEVSAISPLIAEAKPELQNERNTFSNAVTVFHRDGEVSLVAIPSSTKTRKSLGGFLFAKELQESGKNSEKFLDEISDLASLLEGAAKALLKKKWWQKKPENFNLNLRKAHQLLLVANARDSNSLFTVVDLLKQRIANGYSDDDPKVELWHKAILKLESLKDLPSDSIVFSVELEKAASLSKAIGKIDDSFAELEASKNRLMASLDELKEHKVKTSLNAMSISDFALKLRGTGFPRKLVEREVFHKNPARESGEITLGEVLALADSDSKSFKSKSLTKAVANLRRYYEEQKNLLSYPKLSDSGAAFEEFLSNAYSYHLNRQKPYPPQAQFLSLKKLFADSPEALHLIARDKKVAERFINQLDFYNDSVKINSLAVKINDQSFASAKDFFERNPAVFQSLLSSLGFNALSLEQLSGFLNPKLTNSIRNLDLDLSGLKAELRSYQHFGAQYALHQKRIILGDEMGLGKTVTALALATHLKNNSKAKILTVVPLPVLENWRREILKHTDLTSHVLYGENLSESLASWIEKGGIAIATFESIQTVNKVKAISAIKSIELTIVDEAHMIKNPETKRTKAILPWLQSSEYAMLMTGTPMENNLDEFVQLISYMQPELSVSSDPLAYKQFRKSIAPVYLRRNQVDVLQEIPEIIDEEDFIELSKADREYYIRALKNKDWHGARKARMLSGANSSTVQRIKSIVEESIANDDKVLIFSFYRETLEILGKNLKKYELAKPLTGEINAIERQKEVDVFTESKKAGVILAQANIGGTGLNIQAASVVIIVEPQVKPSTEDQMIGRAQRMGQTKNVRVIRLRGKNTVDERWVTMLNEKRKVFNLTARVSDAAAFEQSIETLDRKNLMEEELQAWGI